MSGRGGFTAPELLAVMLLIIMATGVIIVVGNTAHGMARSASCESNLQQIALAMRMYASDNDYRMPPAPAAFEAVMPYMKNWSVLKCPCDPAFASERRRWDKPPEERSIGEPVGTQSSYIMNPFVQADDDPASLIAADNAPDRHLGRRWIGVRLDGATFFWPKDQWQEKIGRVMRDGNAGDH